MGVPLHLTTLRDHNVLHRLAFWVCNGSCVLDLCDNIHAFNNITEDDMLAV
jgi:hypothetical protein